jgi:hypothetical protein
MKWEGEYVEDGRRVPNVGKGTGLTHFTTMC